MKNKITLITVFALMLVMTIGIVSATPNKALWERHTIVENNCVETTIFYADHTYEKELECSPVVKNIENPYIDVKIYEGDELVYWKADNVLKLRVEGSPQDGEVVIPGQIRLGDDFAEYMKIHASIYG